MKTLFCAVFALISVNASADSLPNYIFGRANDLEHDRNRRPIAMSDFVDALLKSDLTPECKIYRVTETTGGATKTLDSYRGPISNIQILQDRGVDQELRGALIQLRGDEQQAYYLIDGAKGRIFLAKIYETIPLSELPGALWKKVTGLTGSFFSGDSEEIHPRITRYYILEFVGPRLTFVGVRVFKGTTDFTFGCGSISY